MSKSLLKLVELLSAQQVNTREIIDNTENFVTVKVIGKNKKTKLNHQQDYRIPLSNSFETLPIEEYQDKLEPTYEDNSMLPSFDHATSKIRHGALVGYMVRHEEKMTEKHLLRRI